MKQETVVPDSASVIYFDGVCVLCNSGVDLVMRHDRNRKFRYATLQSDIGQRLLRDLGLAPDAFDSFILQEGEKKYAKSTAALRIAKNLPGLWPLLYAFILIPRPVRDAAYSWLARRRYQTLGRRDACRVPSDEERHLFLN